MSIHCPEQGSVVITTRRQLARRLSATRIHADATDNIGYIGILASAFMSSATAEAYKEVFRAVKQKLPGPNVPA